MSPDLHVLQPADIDIIMDFEMKLLKGKLRDEEDQAIQSWNARWRRESLEYYLSLGWSFGASVDSVFSGYFLGQALPFLDGQTQSLWIEHFQFLSLQVRDSLIETAIKLGHENHLQKVYFPNDSLLTKILQSYKAYLWQPSVLSIKTTKV